MRRLSWFISVLLVIVFSNCSNHEKVINVRENVYSKDTINWGSNEPPFYYSMVIDETHGIIFNGDEMCDGHHFGGIMTGCHIGYFDKEEINDTVYTKFFTTQFGFSPKDKYLVGYSDLFGFIKLLKTAKIKLIEYSRISRKNGVDNHIKSIGNYFNCYYRRINGVDKITFNFNDYPMARTFLKRVEPNDFVLEFNSTEEIDIWIKKLEEFQKNKFKYVNELYN